MTREEIDAWIQKHYGDYSTYRQIKSSRDVYHHDGAVWTILAKKRNMTIAEYFKTFPDEYREYRRATGVKVGTRVED